MTTTLGWDQSNRLKSYGSNATYAYDGGGLRSSKTVGATTSQFVYDIAEGLPLIMDDGTNAYIYGPQGVVEQVTGSTPTYLHTDQLGSVRLLTNASGVVVGTYQFDAFGNTELHTGTASTPLQFAGQYLDSESNLYWMRARNYDASTGQFISRDVLSAISLSPYGYVDNSPLNAVDPSGYIKWSTVGKVAAGVAVVGRWRVLLLHRAHLA